MRANQRLEDRRIVEVASLLLPLAEQLLLLPNVTVAEIVPLSRLKAVDNAPDWHLGNFVWREQTLPLVSYEALNGDLRPQVAPRSRVAVLNTTGLSDELPFLALLTQGLPRLARVNEDEIREREGGEKKNFDLMPVSIAGEEAVIPDVPRLEQAVLDFLASGR